MLGDSLASRFGSRPRIERHEGRPRRGGRNALAWEPTAHGPHTHGDGWTAHDPGWTVAGSGFLSARTAGAIALSGYPLTDGPRLERNVVVGWISGKAPLLGEALDHSGGA